MDPDMFTTGILDRSIVLQTAMDAARFSFIVQDSVSYLDLELCRISRIPNYFRSLNDRFISRRLKNFINTAENCRKFFAPNRRLLYTQHLDLPKGRECDLKGDVSKFNYYMRCSTSPLVSEVVLICGFHARSLSVFIEDALKINIPKLKILKWILKFPFNKAPLLSCLDSQTASQFVDCFYPSATDSALFKDFIMQFNVAEWMEKYEQPEILEYLLYHVRLFGNIILDDETVVEFVNQCILGQHYRNIGPVLKYLSHSVQTDNSYAHYLLKITLLRPRLGDNLIEKAYDSMTAHRTYRMVQIIWMYMDSHLHSCAETVKEALRLIWCSVPDACVTFDELKSVVGAGLNDEQLKNVYGFYTRTIDEFHEHIEPRPLKHLCRTVLRTTFQVNELWIPEGISRTGLPKSLQSFLNLEKSFAV